MSVPRRLTAAALLLLAVSAFGVPACEVDSTRSRGGSNVAVALNAPVAAAQSGAVA